LERTTFETSRLLEYFSEKELQMQIGAEPSRWPIALLKELIDNSLDACEAASIAPDITVTIDDERLVVCDNGPGLPASVIERSLDYSVRVSDKSYYASPSRGQLGNALKCVWAAPFVIDGKQGRVVVTTPGCEHEIIVRLDRIAQQPTLTLASHARPDVKTGTSIAINWPEVASYLDGSGGDDFYKAIISAHGLIEAYATFNPHAAFTLDAGGQRLRIEPTTTDWTKWQPSDPTSPHWYTTERFTALIGAYLTIERGGGQPRTVREFITEFRGLSGSAKAKAIATEAGLSGAKLSDLVAGDGLDHNRIATLLAIMRSHSRPVKPATLGVLGEDHLRQRLVGRHGVTSTSVKYQKAPGEYRGVPFVWEVAFGVYDEDESERSRTLIVGLNWSPAISTPMQELMRLLGEQRLDVHDPVALIVHLACPVIPYLDHGKSIIDLTSGGSR